MKESAMWFPPKKEAKKWIVILTKETNPKFSYIAIVWSRREQRDRLIALDENCLVSGDHTLSPSLRCMEYLCELHYAVDLKNPVVPEGMSKEEFAVQESLGTLPEVTICEKLTAGLRRRYEEGFQDSDVKGFYKWFKVTL